jgi:hypothetical protein
MFLSFKEKMRMVVASRVLTKKYVKMAMLLACEGKSRSLYTCKWVLTSARK